MITDQQKIIAVLFGTVSAIHQEALRLDAGGIEGMDQVACAMEDVSTMLDEALTGASGPEALSRAL